MHGGRQRCPRLLLQQLLLLGCLAAAAAAADSQPAAQPFFSTVGVTLSNVTKAVARPGQRVVFDSAQPAPGGAYRLLLQLQNRGDRTVAVQSLVADVYTGIYTGALPAGASPALSVPAAVRGWELIKRGGGAGGCHRPGSQARRGGCLVFMQ